LFQKVPKDGHGIWNFAYFAGCGIMNLVRESMLDEKLVESQYKTFILVDRDVYLGFGGEEDSALALNEHEELSAKVSKFKD
jgi:hypothetical protein